MDGRQVTRAATGLVLAALAALALAWLIAPAGTVEAHAGYKRSDPPEGAVLAQSPPRVDVYFSQEMRRSGGLPSVAVVNASGDTVDLGAKLDDDDRSHVSVELPPQLPDGRYTVLWHTLSDEDGEEAQGAFHFYVGPGPQTPGGASSAPGLVTVTPSASSAATAAPPPEGGAGDGGVPVWALVAAAIGAGVVCGGGGLALGRRLGGR
ncbi:MAG: copper resistance protein CopC [Dehalococcoidia bacterium]|nr:copper resistance protein CopC [Dehalococcoidia bacterium]